MNPSVILTCTSYHKAELPNNGMFELGPGGGSIGRDPSCDIVLPDPQKMISRCHAKIITSGTDVLVVDTSSNGLYINGAQSPLGRGGSTHLRDGMQLSFGDLVFSVSLGHVTPQQPEFELQAPPSAIPEPEHSLSSASGATPHEASQPHLQSFSDPPTSGRSRRPWLSRLSIRPMLPKYRLPPLPGHLGQKAVLMQAAAQPWRCKPTPIAHPLRTVRLKNWC